MRTASRVFRLLILAVTAGALTGALMLPVAATAGMAVRNSARAFNAMSTPELGQLPVRSAILDRQGHVLAYYYSRGVDRVPVPYRRIAPVMRQAIVAIEDSRFYHHGAIDFRGTIRALVNNLAHRPVQGGSTIAQQYVKNVEILSAPDPQAAFTSATADTLGRKIRELRMAARVEARMSRDQILTGYLNAAYFGSQAYGIEMAAQRYFSTHAAGLTLPQAALLAGIVQNPAQYDPLSEPAAAAARRDIVLARMAQLGYLTGAQLQAAEHTPLGLHPSLPQSGCTSASARSAAFFCDYVLAVLHRDAAFRKAWTRLNGTGGLRIYTTLDRQDQRAAQRAADYQLPPPPSGDNPGRNAAAEVLLQPGTGKVRAIAIDRRYGTGPHQTTVDYAVESPYDGGVGVQIGSTGKVYTLVTALEQGIPFGYLKHVNGTAVIDGYTNCLGQPAGYSHGVPGRWSLTNDQGELNSATYTLYLGTTLSINTFFAHLERRVGLCSTVRTAARMGLRRADGTSLLASEGKPGHRSFVPSADNIPSFTLGSVNVAPIDVAAADATLPSRGIYCHPIVISKIVTSTGGRLPVESARCHRVLPARIADAANYVLRGDLTSLGTAANDGIGRPAASKTGTSDSYTAAFFVGYTPGLIGAVWVGNPVSPFRYPMQGYPGSCWRGGCPGFMYGSMAPGGIWQLTFLHARLGPPADFVPLPSTDPLFAKGSGQSVPAPPKPKKKPPPKKKPGGGGGGGGTPPGG
ncbi:MAG: transglycosylase domain-containing protein [Gemmatimonadota bacterium]